MYCLILEIEGSSSVDETILILSSMEVPDFSTMKPESNEWTIFFAV